MVRSRVLSWFGNLVLVVVKTYSLWWCFDDDVWWCFLMLYDDLWCLMMFWWCFMACWSVTCCFLSGWLWFSMLCCLRMFRKHVPFLGESYVHLQKIDVILGVLSPMPFLPRTSPCNVPTGISDLYLLNRFVAQLPTFEHSQYLESLVPIIVRTFQSARNFGHWKVLHFRSRISTSIYGTLRVFAALLRLFFVATN